MSHEGHDQKVCAVSWLRWDSSWNSVAVGASMGVRAMFAWVFGQWAVLALVESVVLSNHSVPYRWLVVFAVSVERVVEIEILRAAAGFCRDTHEVVEHRAAGLG